MPDLCTRAEVRLAMELATADTALDPVIDDLLPVATQLIQQDCQRELLSTGSATREFRILGAAGPAPIVDLAPHDLLTATTVTLDPLGSPKVLTANTDYELRPFGGSAVGGVYTEIALSGNLGIAPSSLGDFRTARLRVVGNWGMAAVPELANRAAIIAIRAWLRRDMTSYAEAAEGLDARTLVPSAGGTYALPLAAKTILNPLRRNPIGVM